jgi:amino acid transporter, AAT family
MTPAELTSEAAIPEEKPAASVEREAGLHQNLSSRQMAMIGLGSTIGTGLFLGSAISVKLAGPAVVVSFAAAACIALTVMWALAEMTAEHPAAGSFGLHAEMYLHPWAGFAIRYIYWMCMIVIVGSEIEAAAIYCKFWSTSVPSWVWIVAFGAAILYVNTISVAGFGTFEYWFSMIKVVTIFVFLILGTGLLLGIGFPKIGAANYTAQGGFSPHGWWGVALGVTMGVFSFLGLEVVASTAGEAAEPKKAVPRALRRTLFSLILFYLVGLALVVGIVPWNQIDLGKSPFVRVFETAGIPAASHVMNFVVLTAALSSAAANLYFGARLMFSLSRGGYAPAVAGRVNRRGMPAAAVLATGVGSAIAIFVSHQFQGSAFVFLIGLAFFGGPFIWIMTLLTHLAFRRAHAKEGKEFVRIAPRGPWSSMIGLVALVAVLISTWWVPGFRVTLKAGPPALAFVTLCYFVWRSARNRSGATGVSSNG